MLAWFVARASRADADCGAGIRNRPPPRVAHWVRLLAAIAFSQFTSARTSRLAMTSGWGWLAVGMVLTAAKSIVCAKPARRAARRALSPRLRPRMTGSGPAFDTAGATRISVGPSGRVWEEPDIKKKVVALAIDL